MTTDNLLPKMQHNSILAHDADDGAKHIKPPSPMRVTSMSLRGLAEGHYATHYGQTVIMLASHF